MYFHFLRIVWKSLFNRKFYSLINILGLSVGFLVAILTFQYASNEISYDTHITDSDHIYRVALQSFQDGKLSEQSATSYSALGPEAKRSIPAVKEFTRFFRQPGVMSLGESTFFEENGYFADSAAIRMFSIEMVKGDASSIARPGNILISENLEEKYFAGKSAVGQTILFEEQLYEVAGIFKHHLSPSHLQMDFLLYYPKEDELFGYNWRWRKFYTYLNFHPDTDVASVEEKLNQLLIENNKDFYIQENRKDEVMLQPIKSIHLKSRLDKELGNNGSATMVGFLFAIGILVLFLSWFNFINLALAHTEKRKKEIGLKRILGASGNQVILESLAEAIILNLLAAILAVIIYFAIFPWFNSLAEIATTTSIWLNREFLLLLSLTIIIGIGITGLYPSYLVSGYNRTALFRKTFFKNDKLGLLRKVVVFQFIVTTILIIGCVVVYKQVAHITTKFPGFYMEQVLVVKMYEGKDYSSAASAFRDELMFSPYFTSISASDFVPGQEVTRIRGIKRLENGSDAYHTFANTYIDQNFIGIYDIEILAGRGFETYSPESNEVVLNEQAIRILGYQSPQEAINRHVINGDRNPDTLRIVGVLKDYYQRSVEYPIAPMVFLPGKNTEGLYSLKVKEGQLDAAMELAEDSYNRHFNGKPFDYYFLDDWFDDLYKRNRDFAVVFLFFTIIAILISCLGLFAMVKHTTERRTKELGIRKVIGASVSDLIAMVLIEFLRLVVLAIFIAVPISWLIMSRWLEHFSDQIALDWLTFGFAGMLVLLIASFTVVLQSASAALANPAHSLRSD